MMNCLKMNVMCHVRNGMEWIGNGMDWNGKYMIHCGSCLPIYLVKGYLSSWNGWMDGFNGARNQ